MSDDSFEMLIQQLPEPKEMKSLREYRIIAHVHDEVILEVPMETSLDCVCELMGRTPPWVPGLELRAEGYQCGFYQKQ